jgi:hypothetical protein
MVVEATLLPKLSDGMHLHPKKKPKKIKFKLLLCWDLAMVSLVPRSNKNFKNKNRKEAVQAPPMLKLRDGIHLHQKQQNQKNGGSWSSLYVNTWWWCLAMPKSKQKKGGAKLC